MSTNETDMQKEYDFSQARQGPIVPVSPNKTRITIRLDTDILNWFRERVNAMGGGSYQALINQALREHIENADMDWEATLRRVVREELKLAKVSSK
ncbi:MAG: BrnA antitoxin family protein [Anaerolineales bacterium]|nr:BrnA antitoxin family protein [Anaerolineales bacterium]